MKEKGRMNGVDGSGRVSGGGGRFFGGSPAKSGRAGVSFAVLVVVRVNLAL